MEEKCREKENGKRNENVVSSPILYHTIEVSLYKASMSRSNLILVSSFSLYLACVQVYSYICACVYVRYVNIYTHTYTSSLYLCYQCLQIYRAISTEQMGNIIFANKNDDVRKMKANIRYSSYCFLISITISRNSMAQFLTLCTLDRKLDLVTKMCSIKKDTKRKKQ